MRDAMGGTVTLMIIVVFIVVALGYMAYNVNYTKAFRMKNKIISLYQDYEGDCSGACLDSIVSYANEIGYKPARNLRCPSGFSKYGSYYCFRRTEFEADSNLSSYTRGNGASDIKKREYYTIVTKININIPIISNVLNLEVFQISGDTESFEVK